jgi:hypothetical protein
MGIAKVAVHPAFTQLYLFIHLIGIQNHQQRRFTMKYAFVVLLAFTSLATPLQAQNDANAIERYFAQYLEDERFSVVYISPKLFQMIDRIGAEQLELDEQAAATFREVARDLRGLRILSTDVTPQQFYQEAKQRINTKEYEPLMTVRDRGGDNVEFLVRENGQGIIEELLLLAGGADEFTLLSFVGRIDLDKVARLAREMEDKD